MAFSALMLPLRQLFGATARSRVSAGAGGRFFARHCSPCPRSRPADATSRARLRPKRKRAQLVVLDLENLGRPKQVKTRVSTTSTSTVTRLGGPTDRIVRLT